MIDLEEEPNEEPHPGEGLPAITLSGAQQLVDDWIKQVGVRYFSELTNLAQLVEEVGELSRLFSRTYGEQSFKGGERQGPEAIADELADVLWVVLCLANQTGTDLSQALLNNLKKKTLRDATRHLENAKLTDGDEEA